MTKPSTTESAAETAMASEGDTATATPVPSVGAGASGRSGRPTLRDVAAVAQVSFKTVSRVVNNEPRVRPETAERVNQAIRELGFSRNYIASSLKRGMGAATIGLVIADVANPFFAVIARAVEEVAREREHLVVTASTDEDTARETDVIEALIERRVRGMLVVPVGHDHRFVSQELAMGTPIVFLDRPPGLIEADSVMLDNMGGARLAVSHLVAHGHRRIAILGDRLDVHTLGERFQGYREALSEAGIAVDEAFVRFGCHDTAEAAAAVRDLLDSPNPPTAIFATNNRMSVGSVDVLADRDQPVALVGFDDFELAAALRLPVTVVSYDTAELGRRAAEMLFARLDGDDGPPSRITMPTHLIERGSGELAGPGH